MSHPSAPLSRTWLGRGIALLALAVIAALTLTIAAAEPAQGQAAPPAFPCDGGLYVATGSPGDMYLHRVDQNDGSLRSIGADGLVGNAVAHNPADDYLYGMGHGAPHEVVRFHADGTQAILGTAAGAPADWEITAVGTFLENGRYLVLGDTVPATAPRGTVPAVWAEIDVTTSPPTVRRTFSHPSVGNNVIWDAAVSPIDGELYGFDLVADRIVRIDTATGASTPVGPTQPALRLAGSSFFDSFGRLWLYGAVEGTTTQETLFRIDDIATDTARVVGSGPAVTYSDGASCPFSVGMEKTASPESVCAGGTTTFTIPITNESANGAAITADFTDRLDDGLTFVPGSLVNPFGGQVNDYGGTGELSITDMTLPGGGAEAITVDVAVPADAAPSTFTNQAGLVNLSGNVGPAVLSEFPGTPQFPDPTPVDVRSCVDLAVEKSTAAPSIGPGGDVTYDIRLTNLGPSDARSIDSLADVLPAGTSFVRGSEGGSPNPFGVVTWPIFDLPAGMHRDFSITVQGDGDVTDHADGDGKVVNVITVDHPGDDNPDNDVARASVPVARPDLALVKDDGIEVVEPGAETTYELTATNHGEGAARGAVVTDTLPEGTDFVAASSGGTAEEGVVTWSGLDLDPGESEAMTVTVTVHDDMTSEDVVTNVAVVTHDDDPDPTDNEDLDVDEVVDVPRIIGRNETKPPGPTGFLPRTGTELLNWTWVAAALLGVGGVAWVAGNKPRNP